jgi:hypothetical protein
MRVILSILLFLVTLTIRADELYIVQVNSVLAISPGAWQQCATDADRGDKASCQEMVNHREAILVTQAEGVYLVGVEGNLAVVRLIGSNESLWTSVTSIKKN